MSYNVHLAMKKNDTIPVHYKSLHTFTLNSNDRTNNIYFVTVKNICSTNCYNKNYTLITHSQHSLNRQGNERCKTINKSPKIRLLSFHPSFHLFLFFLVYFWRWCKKPGGQNIDPEEIESPAWGLKKEIGVENFSLIQLNLILENDVNISTFIGLYTI